MIGTLVSETAQRIARCAPTGPEAICQITRPAGNLPSVGTSFAVAGRATGARLLRRAGVLAAAFLLVLLAARSSPPPAGAVAALWQSAAELRALSSYAASVDALDGVAALRPDDPEPLLAIGDIYLAQRRWPLAADAFNRALARRLECAPAWAGLASASWGSGDRLRATAHWETTLSHQPDLMPARLGLARAYLEQDRPSDAETVLRTGLSLASTQADLEDSVAAHLLLAAMLALDDPAGARAELEAVPDGAADTGLAQRDYLRQALELAQAAASPAEAAKRTGLAFVQVELWPLAYTALAPAVALDPSDAEAMAFLGHAEAQLGRPALIHLITSVALRPDWALGHYLLGLHYLQQSLPHLADSELEAAVRLDLGNAQAWLDLAGARVARGEYEAAAEAFDASIAAAPSELSFVLARAYFYADTSWRVADRGMAAAQAAADLAPQDPEARDLMGWMYFLAGDLPQARLHLLSALRLDAGRASTAYHLGELYAALGLSEQARMALLRAIDLDAEGWVRERAQRALQEL